MRGFMAAQNSEGWSSKIGVILAVAGSAVGLGNFLRFPGQAAQNGGGAFMVPYFVSLLLIGIPIGWMEWTISRMGGLRGFHSAPGIFGVVGRGAVSRYLGVLGLVIPVVIAMYYVLIESWCLRYFIGYLTGSVDLGADPAGYSAASQNVFAQFTGANGSAVFSQTGVNPAVWFWLATFAVNLVFVYRGLSKGIERFCSLAMPLMALAAVVVLVRVLTLGTPDPEHPDRNVLAGLGHMWNPDWSHLANFKTWLAAAGQIFFSLSVGFGVILNYASYLKRRDDVVLSGLASAATNEMFEVGFGGMITIPAAFIFLGVSGAAGGTFGLGFNTLPVVFEHMGGVGRAIGAIWFFMLFLAAITSSLSMLQPAIAFLSEALGVDRARAVGLLAGLMLMGSGWVIFNSEGLVALDTMDFWVGTFLIFIMASAQCYLFVFKVGVRRGLQAAHEGAEVHIPRFYRPIMTYVTPTFLVVVFVGFCVDKLPEYLASLADNPVARNTSFVVLGVIALLALVTRLGERRWLASGRDLNGRGPVEEKS